MLWKHIIVSDSWLPFHLVNNVTFRVNMIPSLVIVAILVV